MRYILDESSDAFFYCFYISANHGYVEMYILYTSFHLYNTFMSWYSCWEVKQVTATLKLGKPKTTVQDRVSVFVSAKTTWVSLTRLWDVFQLCSWHQKRKLLSLFFFFFFAKEGPNRGHWGKQNAGYKKAGDERLPAKRQAQENPRRKQTEEKYKNLGQSRTPQGIKTQTQGRRTDEEWRNNTGVKKIHLKKQKLWNYLPTVTGGISTVSHWK